MDGAHIDVLGPDDHVFFLPMARILVVERECNRSLFELFPMLGSALAKTSGQFVLAEPCAVTLEQCHSIIRNALIGAGMGEREARDMVQTYCAPARPAVHDMGLAWHILEQLVYGIQIKKKTNSPASDEASGEADQHSSAAPSS